MTRTAAVNSCDCLLCHPVPGRAAHPKYGYDLAVVPTMTCITCKRPIGDEAYVEELGTARFGWMDFRHARCETPKDARARARMERNWDRRN